MTVQVTFWTRADGQLMKRVVGTHRIAPTKEDGPAHPLDGQPYWFDVAVHEPIPMPKRAAASKKQPDWRPRPPRRPAFDLDPATPTLPTKIRTAHDRLQAAGWAVRLTGAEGPNGEITAALRASSDKGRVVMLWDFAPPHWTKATKARAPRWVAEPEWKNAAALIATSRRSDGKWAARKVSHTDALKEATR